MVVASFASPIGEFKKRLLAWSIAQWQELLQHLPKWSPLSQVLVCRIWWESDLVDHQTKDIVVRIGKIFLINPSNITACCTKYLQKCLCIELTTNRMFRHGINYNTCSKHSWSNEIVQSVAWRRNSCNQNLYILQHILLGSALLWMFTVLEYHYLEGFSMVFRNCGICSYWMAWVIV